METNIKIGIYLIIASIIIVYLFNELYLKKGLVIFEERANAQGIKEKRTVLKKYYLFTVFLKVTIFELGKKKFYIYIRKIKKGKKYKKVFSKISTILKTNK